MKTDLFDYILPERLIAQKPADRRDESRLLVVDRQARTVEHRHFRDLPNYLKPGDCLFRNNAAVIPARLHGVRPTGGRGGSLAAGGRVECLLLRPAQERGEWWCLLRPGRKLPLGATFGIEGIFTATVREKTADGLARVAFGATDGDVLTLANRIGEMPLPPYIGQRRSKEERALDRERYQTIYADRARPVAVAAPTAGLHFTPELLRRLAAQGIITADLTLHVGLGTFRPITADSIEDHTIHREVYEIPSATLRALSATRGRRIAVGTTAVRSIEDFLTTHPEPDRWSGLTSRRSERVGAAPLPLASGPVFVPAPAREANALDHDRSHLSEAAIFIRPPHEFRGVDALITNFHQPRSTLLCLVAAFLTPGSTDGIAWLKEIYAEAIAREYRFFSYGDAMLIQ